MSGETSVISTRIREIGDCVRQEGGCFAPYVDRAGIALPIFTYGS